MIRPANSRRVGVTIDMTERKHAEEKIIEQAALLDEARDAIIISDLKGCTFILEQGCGTDFWPHL